MGEARATVSSRTPAYFIDTSYLVEFFKVPDLWKPDASAIVTKKLNRAWKLRHAVYLPAVCLLELGNHITKVRGQTAIDLAKRVTDFVKRSRLDDGEDALAHPKAPLPRWPFTIVESPARRDLPAVLDTWWQTHLPLQRSLIDACLADGAHLFARDRAAFHTVHIWTTDKRLKAAEPDREAAPSAGTK